MSDLVVQTAFTTKGDTVTTALNRQAKAADTLGGRLKAAFAGGAKQAGIFGSVLAANLASKAITAGLSKIQQMAMSTLDSYIDFDTAITMAASKFPEKIKRGTKEFDDLAAAARLVGKETTFSASQAAEGFNALAGAGFNMGQSIAAIKPLVAFATAANTDLASSTTTVADALGAFNLKSADAAILTANMTRLTDAFVFVTSTQKTSVEELSEAVKMGGPAFTGAGQSMEHFVAMTGLLASTGIKGGQAGTALRSSMLKLAAPTGAAAAALKTLGVSTKDDADNLREFGDIITDIAKATEGMGTGKKTELLQKIFGTESISGAMALINMGGDKLAGYEDQLASAAGKSDEMTKEIKQTLGNRLADLGSTVEEFGFKLITAFEKDGKDAIGQAIDAINEFDVKPIVEGVNELLDGMKWLFRTIRDNWETVKAIAISFAAIKIAISGMSFINAIAGFGQMASAATAAATASTAAATAAKGAGGAAPVATAAKGAGGAAPVATAAGTSPGGMATGAVAAAGIGYTIGTAIEENLLNPMREAGDKFEVELNNLVHKFGGVGRGSVNIGEMSAAELQKGMAQITVAKEKAGFAIDSIDETFLYANSVLQRGGAHMAEFFGLLTADQAAAIVEQNKGPVREQKEQLEALNRAYQEMAAALVIARANIDAAAKAATTEINVNVANAPAGTTVQAKGTPQPKVNQGQAGKS